MRAHLLSVGGRLPSGESAAAVQYFEPNFIDEALVLLERYAPDAHVLAGGTLLGPEIRSGASEATAIVNVKRIPSLREIAFDGRVLTIGALATAHDLARDDLVKRHAPLVARAAASLGARQLRTVATIGGNLCSGHHAADLSVALLASEAVCLLSDVVSGPEQMSVEEFIQLDRAARGYRLLTAVEIPQQPAACAFEKMQTRRAFEMALVSAAVALEVDSGVVRDARIALGGAASVPVRARNAEKFLRGVPASDETARGAAQRAARDDANPADDPHAGSAYRHHLVEVLTLRALRSAFGQGAH